MITEMGAAALLLDMRSWIPGPTELLFADPEAALHGAAWLIASVLVGWLLVTTAAAVVVRLFRIRVAPLDWITLPPIRRLAERATAITLVASSMAAPSAALASEAPPIPVVVVVETPQTTSPAGVPAAPAPGVAQLPIIGQVVAPSAQAAAVATAPVTGGFPSAYPLAVPHMDRSRATDAEFRRHVVAPGESMWTITADHLSDHLGSRPSNRQISEVWRVVMDLNRDSIRSGDVDLIFPGEELLLPALEA